ncbi:uncharacterized protein LOC122386391 [Amphibalanus amphitrite]|uniref:uncharacterized protein LOC122386391 n=1 Tax=Amphibalanus amphitrite TaxID=1232801 RepID=UPI001C91073D|nr:uncharacterized protein LOC122386391 [Amphibalanus amphitrite]
MDITPDRGTADLEAACNKHESVFDGTPGRISGVKAHLTLKPDARPVSRPVRSPPYALKPAVEQELDRWVQAGIAEKVGPNDAPGPGWGTPLVTVPRADGGVRLFTNVISSWVYDLERNACPCCTIGQTLG